MSSTPSSPTSDKSLDVTLYHIATLLEQWNLDKAALSQREAALKALLDQINHRLDTLDNFEDSATDALKKQLEQMVDRLSREIKDIVGDHRSAFSELSKEVRATRLALAHSQQPFWGDWKMVAATIAILAGIGIFSGLITAKFFMPQIRVSLSSDNIAYMEKGRVLNAIWPKLSKGEQNRIIKLAEARLSK